MHPPTSADDWIGIGPDPLPVADALAWCARPSCGAQVAFVGTVRDHSEGHPGVWALEYEAYEEMVGPKLGEVAAEARRRWPSLGRIAMLHRTGHLGVGEASVLVVVCAPHREEAFAAARYCIDELKAEAPIWKREHWDGGAEWVGSTEHPAGVRP